ncbi:MAG: LptF/LptG family permease [Rhodothermaceae bacterium]|nr:LptF/LptG family permease [Rhodothermaceae bacterium]
MKFRLSSIQLEVLKRHAGPFVFCFSIIMFLLLLQFLVLHLDKIVGKDIPFTVIIELISVNLAYMVVMAVPMSILVACLMTFGSFAETNELAALKAAGISPFSVIKPVLFVAILFSVFLTWFSNDVLPEANYRARALFMDIRMKKPGFDLKQNVFYEGIDGYSFLVRQVEAGGDSLYNITLFQQPSSERDQAVIKAKSGYLKSDERYNALTLYLFNGSVLRDIPSNVTGKTRVEETDFSTYRIQFDVADLNFSRSDPAQHRRDDRTMSSQAMKATVDSLNREIDREYKQFMKRSPIEIINGIIATKDPLMVNTSENRDTTSSPVPADIQMQTMPENDVAANSGFSAAHSDSLIGANEYLIRFETLRHMPDKTRMLFVADNSIATLREMSSAAVNLGNSVRWRMERAAQYMVEVHKKISIPIGCIIFVLLGAPLGMLTKKGNIGFNAVVSTILFTYYWMGIIQGEKLADRMIISAFTGMWFANITLLAVGLILIAKR